jgi:hypothetical protein
MRRWWNRRLRGTAESMQEQAELLSQAVSIFKLSHDEVRRPAPAPAPRRAPVVPRRSLRQRRQLPHRVRNQLHRKKHRRRPHLAATSGKSFKRTAAPC